MKNPLLGLGRNRKPAVLLFSGVIGFVNASAFAALFRNTLRVIIGTVVLSFPWVLQAASASPTVVDQVNWSEFLARQDLVWSKIPRGMADGVALGNGQIGASITGQHKGLFFALYREDVTDARPFRSTSWGSPLFDTCRLRIGGFNLNPVGQVKSFESRLGLWDALSTGTVVTDKGKIRWRSFVHASSPLVIIEFTTEGDERNFGWQWVPASTSSSRWEGLKHKLKPPAEVSEYQPNPPAASEQLDGVNVSVHPLNAGGHFAVAWRESRSETSVRTITATIAPVSDHAKQDAAATVAKAGPTETLLESHRKTWHERYRASFLSIPDPRLESYYWINIYKLYSATRADQPPIDVHGMWLTSSGWPNIWWNMNIQLAYYPQATANRLELAESLCSSLERLAPALSANVPIPEWRNDSAWINRVSDQQLRSGTKPGWPASHELANLSWAMEAYWRQCRYSGDDERLRTKFLPLLERCFGTYRHAFKKKEDGKWHLPITVSPEYTNAEDANYDLGAVRWDLKILINESQRLGINSDKIADWKSYQQNITPFPRGPEGLWIGANKPLERSHRHYSHLLAIYPLGVLDWDNPEDRPLIRQSVDFWYNLFSDPKRKKERFFGYSYTGASSMYAWMENGGKANEAIQGYLDHCATPNAFYNDGTLEGGFSVCQTVHDLLMQSRNGIIRVFPALPPSWKTAVFHNLRAEGAFLVSAAFRNGKTQWVRVKSLAGEPCRIRIDGKEQTLKLAKDEEILLSQGSAVVEPVPADPSKANFYGAK